MKHKYITLDMQMAFLSKPVIKKDIHSQLAETIEERKRILRRLETYSQRAKMIDMYLDTTKAA